MPMKSDPDKKTESGIYKTQIEQSKKYDQSKDNIRLRLPKGWKAKMQERIANDDKYNSINDFICKLISEELNIEYP